MHVHIVSEVLHPMRMLSVGRAARHVAEHIVTTMHVVAAVHSGSMPTRAHAAVTTSATAAATTTARQRFARKVTGAQKSGDCESNDDIPAHAFTGTSTAPNESFPRGPE